MATRILHVINGEFYAGAERVQDLLALRLPDFGYEVGFCCVKPDKFPGQRKAKEAPLYLTPMASRFDIKVGFQLARIIREGGYMLVHTHTPRAALVGRIAAALTHIPMIHHVHSPASRDTENAARNLINTWIERLTRSGVARIVPVSKSLVTYLEREKVEPEKICMVANGVSTPGPLLIREPPEKEWTIGCVALFRPRKGIEVLIEAMAILLQEGFSCHLKVVGEFESLNYRKKIIELVEQKGVANFIEWVGFSQKIDQQLSTMDILVLPSLFGEGMPMVILEAMAMGVPVVASDVEGVKEVIEDEVNGRLVSPGDILGLAGALARMIKSKSNWSSIREAAYRKQCKEFSDVSMAKNIADIYREVLE